MAVLLGFGVAAGVGIGWSFDSWQEMWGLSPLIFCVCKVLTAFKVGDPNREKRLAAYLFAWPGMNAREFLHAPLTESPPRPSEWVTWTGNLFAGCLLLFVVPRSLSAAAPGLAAWTSVTGVLLLLHFGVFGILSGYWRLRGVAAPPLMQHPTRSTNLAEFWGRRWNTAFRDLSQSLIFLPVAQRHGAAAASFCVFLASGVIHDVVISLPAGGGYGGPTLYFLLQWLGLVSERTGLMRKHVRGKLGWFWTAAFVVVPLPLLVHQPFLFNVVLPMLRDWGCLS